VAQLSPLHPDDLVAGGRRALVAYDLVRGDTTRDKRIHQPRFTNHNDRAWPHGFVSVHARPAASDSIVAIEDDQRIQVADVGLPDFERRKTPHDQGRRRRHRQHEVKADGQREHPCGESLSVQQHQQCPEADAQNGESDRARRRGLFDESGKGQRR